MSEEMEQGFFQVGTQEGDEHREKHRPHFSVKMNGNYVGSAWLSEGKFGKYVSVAVNHDVPKGGRINVYPTRENAAILG